ncbi:hypothetical protein NMY22_g19699 [Coprinellus aureogranulatus]|nr:hypothetical protein NMY22_g19699 [Coprinellus aureogranulatus]
MKVFLPAIVGLVPDRMCREISAFLDFCYLVRPSQIDEDVLDKIDDATERFYRERDAFVEAGIRDHFNLPRQHSLVHYRLLIQLFGAPNEICSSITESKHITDVKDAYRRSSRNQLPGEVLLFNQRMDKLAAARDRLEPQFPFEIRDPRGYRRTIHTTPIYPRSFPKLSEHLALSRLRDHGNGYRTRPPNRPNLHVRIFRTATALFHEPSDLSGVGGMLREQIRATPSWQKKGPRHDCVYIESDHTQEGFRGLIVAQVHSFLSFKFRGIKYECTLVRWFERWGYAPCDGTGMWVV